MARNRQDNLDVLLKSLSVFRDSKAGSDYEALYSELLSGNCVYLVDGYEKYISASANTKEGRSIAEPTSQTIIRGPKDCFTEKLMSNLMLVRKRIKNKAVKTEIMTLGTVTKTTVSIMYITELAREDVVTEINRVWRKSRSMAFLRADILKS